MEWRCSVGEEEQEEEEEEEDDWRGEREIEKFFCIISRDEMYYDGLIAQIAHYRNQSRRHRCPRGFL